MKKILSIAAAFVGFATAASAADFPVVPVKAALPVPVIFSWSGCYIGVEGGGNWGRSEQIARTNGAANDGRSITNKFDLSGGIAGGTVGCNVQLSNFVIGAENDFSWTNKRGSVNDLPPFNTASISETREKWIDTFRGRFGYAIDRFMVYGTAGVAFAGTEVRVTNPASGTLVDSKDRTGWVVGLGGEWAAWSTAWGDVTFKLEYLHAGFETKQYFIQPITIGGLTVVTRDTYLSDDMVRAGMNVKFNWDGPLVARY
jgi:outer membrane immunogenic protein